MRQIKNETRESTKVQLAGKKMKLCSKCKQWKEIDEFSKDRTRKDQRYGYCRECNREKKRKSNYKHKSQGNCIECGKKNPTNRAYCEKCRENERLRSIKRRKTLEYKDRMKQYVKNRRKTDIQFKLRDILRTRINHALKNNYKSGSAVRDLGCTIPELIVHLESQFVDGMNWGNHGKWQIDHIVPLSKVDLTNREEFLKVCNYSNLRPLWTTDNIRRNFSNDVIMGKYT